MINEKKNQLNSNDWLNFYYNFSLKANQYKIRVMSTSNQGSTWGKLELQFITRDGANETFILTNEADEIKDTGFIQV
jgi:Lhr-like helicase